MNKLIQTIFKKRQDGKVSFRALLANDYSSFRPLREEINASIVKRPTISPLYKHYCHQLSDEKCTYFPSTMHHTFIATSHFITNKYTSIL